MSSLLEEHFVVEKKEKYELYFFPQQKKNVADDIKHK